MMQVLGVDLAILDKIDSGLDVDALRDFASAVNRILTPKNSLMMITHYRRILDLLNPTHVYVMRQHFGIRFMFSRNEMMANWLLKLNEERVKRVEENQIACIARMKLREVVTTKLRGKKIKY
ncbi:hypothetical protein HN51_008778 [Arachis hypogaea]|nr:ABC transporter I family member [Arachis hypogaea]